MQDENMLGENITRTKIMHGSQRVGCQYSGRSCGVEDSLDAKVPGSQLSRYQMCESPIFCELHRTCDE